MASPLHRYMLHMYPFLLPQQHVNKGVMKSRYICLFLVVATGVVSLWF